VNPNTGEPLGMNRLTKVVENTVYHEPTHASAVKLFVMPSKPQVSAQSLRERTSVP
jgi:hypothetical protein